MPIFFIYNFLDTNKSRIFVVSEVTNKDSSEKDKRHSTRAARLPCAAIRQR